jgi:hypothetical protein
LRLEQRRWRMAIGFMYFVTLAARAIAARKTEETSSDKHSRPQRPHKSALRRVRHRRFDPGAVAAAFGRVGRQTGWRRVGMLLCVGAITVVVAAGPALARAPRRAPPPGKAIAALRAALKDRDSRVRREAVYALRRLGPRAEAALIQALRSSDPVVRASAVSALGRVGDRKALAALSMALKDQNARVRREAVYALRRLGPKAEAALVGALRSGDPVVRAGAVSALGRVGGAGRKAGAKRSRPRPRPAAAPGIRSKRLVRVQATLTVEEPARSGARGAGRARKRKRVIRIQATFKVDPKTVKALFSGKGTPSRRSR